MADLTLDDVLPFDRPMSAGPNDTFVGMSETGDKIYETLTGQQYSIREATKEETDARQPLPMKAEKWVDEGMPLPSWDEITTSVKGMPKAMYDTVDRVTDGTGTFGDVFGTIGASAAPGAATSLVKGVKHNPNKTSIFYSPDDDVVINANEMKDMGRSREEIAMTLGVWQDPKSKKWLAETDDSRFRINPTVTSYLRRAENPNAFIRNTNESVLPHEELYKLFPELKDNPTQVFPDALANQVFGSPTIKGQYKHQGSELSLRSSAGADVALHELQHAVDKIEGRDPGASPSKLYHDLSSTYDNLPPKFKGYLGLVSKSSDTEKAALEMKDMLKEFDDNAPEGWGYAGDSLSKEKLEIAISDAEQDVAAFKERMKILEEENPDLAGSLKYLYKVVEVGKPYERNINKQHEPSDKIQGAYERNAGETLANKTMGRQKLNGYQRLLNDPWADPEPGNVWTQRELKNALSKVQTELDRSRSGTSYYDELLNLPTGEPKEPLGRFAEGGMVLDPVSKNPVPVGATPKEVRDDVPIMVSEGEYVIPANVVRFLGLDKIEKLVSKAKTQLEDLDKQGRIGGKSEDDLPFSPEELQAIDAPEEAPQAPPKMAEGGLVPTTGTGSQDIDPVTGMPKWMSANPYSVPSTLAPAPPTPPTPATTPTAPTTILEKDKPVPQERVKPVNEWSPEQFEKYAVARTSPAGNFMQMMASMVPGGGLMAKAQQKNLERKVPLELEKMLTSQTDLQGNPLSTEQMASLSAAYEKMTTEPLNGFGLKGLVRTVAEDTGLVQKRQPTPEDKKAPKPDGIVSRVIDAVTQSGKTKEEKAAEKEAKDKEKADKEAADKAASSTTKK